MNTLISTWNYTSALQTRDAALASVRPLSVRVLKTVEVNLE